MIEIFIFIAFTAFLQTECQGKLFVLKSILPLQSVEVVAHSTSVIMCYQHFGILGPMHVAYYTFMNS